MVSQSQSRCRALYLLKVASVGCGLGKKKLEEGGVLYTPPL
jgi:hypothetical protein